MTSSQTFENTFDKYRQVKSSTDTLFTIVLHKLPVSKVLKAINHRHELAKNMKVSNKKKIVCLQFSQFEEYLQTMEQDDQLDSVFLIGEKITEIKLDKQWLAVLSDYQVDNFIFKYGYEFEIDYLKLLLTDLSFKHVFYVRNNCYIYLLINSTKKKEVFEKQSKYFCLETYIKNNIRDQCLIHGVSSCLNSIKQSFKSEPHLVFTHKLTDEEIFQEFLNYEMGKLHLELEKNMAMIQNEKLIHRLVFGKDIEKRIIEQGLQTLYCSPDMYDKVMKKVPKQYLSNSFKIHKILSLTKGDTGDRLKTDFSGLLGVTYF